MKVAIIVLNYNGKSCLLGCLKSLEKLQYRNKEIIVVDNASQDGSLELAKANFPRFSYIRNAKNLGFAGGMNVGLRAALKRGAHWLWLFNNDAEAEENTLSVLMRETEKHPQGGLFSPVILENISGKVWFSGGKINYWRMRTEHNLSSITLSSRQTKESEFLTGCAMLIRSSVLGEIGLLDERFFLYYEDADLCLRALQSGFKNFVVPQGLVWHAEKSRTNPKKIYHLIFSGLLFFHKHASWYARLYFWVYVTIRKMKNCLDMLLGKEQAFVVRQAYDDYASGKPPVHFPDFR